MKLKYVQIENFRSINDVDIWFNPSFRILVGKNESGKTNILDALAMLSNDFTPTPQDLREPLPNESPIENALIRFVFELTLEDRQKVFDELVLEIHPDDVELPILTKSKKLYTLRDFCIDRSEYLFTASLKASSNSRQNTYWAIPSSFKIISGWKKPKEGNTTEFSAYSLVNEKRFAAEEMDQFQNVSTEYINKIVGQKIIEVQKSSTPDVLFWKYDEANILPPSIDLASFAANPETCIPLMNMFRLAGVSDIQKETTEAQHGSPNQLRNLLNRIANHSTSYLRQIWQENKDVEFCLEPNGPNIDITIKENNRYSFSQRSDGFKRFVTFLLMISTSCATDDLTDCLILIDEPENGIHPSGVRYLRDELKKISKKNYVVVATHSIFMVDEDDIGRHYIVTKKEEKSSVHVPDEHNLAEEEVIYKALAFLFMKF